MSRFLVSKGPIAVDGVSLTLNFPVPGTRKVPGTDLKGRFQVYLVAHTLTLTTLGRKPQGGFVNLEVDPVAKYLHRML